MNFIYIFTFTRFCVLACDGVWDEVDDQDAVDIVSRESDLMRSATRLRDAAYLRNSDDNISAIVIQITPFQ